MRTGPACPPCQNAHPEHPYTVVSFTRGAKPPLHRYGLPLHRHLHPPPKGNVFYAKYHKISVDCRTFSFLVYLVNAVYIFMKQPQKNVCATSHSQQRQRLCEQCTGQNFRSWLKQQASAPPSPTFPLTRRLRHVPYRHACTRKGRAVWVPMPGAEHFVHHRTFRRRKVA